MKLANIVTNIVIFRSCDVNKSKVRYFIRFFLFFSFSRQTLKNTQKFSCQITNAHTQCLHTRRQNEISIAFKHNIRVCTVK